MKQLIIAFTSFGIATSASAIADDFSGACKPFIDPEKSFELENCVKEQKEAFLKIEALKQGGHAAIVKQCVVIDHRPRLALGERGQFTNWKRVEACTRAFL